MTTDPGDPRDEPRIRPLPFKIGVLGDFVGPAGKSPGPLTERSFIPITFATFDSVLRSIEPGVSVTVPNTLSGEGNLRAEICFTALDDFSPRAVARKVPALAALLQARQDLHEVELCVRSAPPLRGVVDLILADAAVLEGLRRQYGVHPSVAATTERQYTSDLLARYAEAPVGREDAEALVAKEMRCQHETAVRFLEILLRQPLSPSENGSAQIASLIAELDRKLREQLELILHDASFQALEATWRGLRRLVAATRAIDGTVVHLLHITYRDLRPLEASAGDHPLIRLVRDAELETWGGQPFSLLVGDLPIFLDKTDLPLRRLCEIARAAEALLITCADAGSLGLGRFRELETRDIGALLRRPDFASWTTFREDPLASFGVITLPRTLVRRHDTQTQPGGEFSLGEKVDEMHAPWGNSAYLLAEVLAGAFSDHHFCGRRVRGSGGGGELELPASGVDVSTGVEVGPSEWVPSDPRCSELAAQGFTPLMVDRGTNRAAFPVIRSCARTCSDPSETPSSVEHRLVVLRLRHHVISEIRRLTGRYETLDCCEDAINQRFSDEIARHRRLAKTPPLLRCARITLTRAPTQEVRVRLEVSLRRTSMLDRPRRLVETFAVRLPH